MTIVKSKSAAFSAIALRRSAFPTISTKKAWRAGISTAAAIPVRSAKARTWCKAHEPRRGEPGERRGAEEERDVAADQQPALVPPLASALANGASTAIGGSARSPTVPSSASLPVRSKTSHPSAVARAKEPTSERCPA